MPRGRCVPLAGLPAAWAHIPVGLGGTRRGAQPGESPSCSCRASEQPRFDKVPALITSEAAGFSQGAQSLRLVRHRPSPGSRWASPARRGGHRRCPPHGAGTWRCHGGHAEAGTVPGTWQGWWQSQGSCRRTKPPCVCPSCKGRGQRLSTPRGRGRTARAGVSVTPGLTRFGRSRLVRPIRPIRAG